MIRCDLRIGTVLGIAVALLLGMAAVRGGDVKANSVAASFDDDWIVVNVQGPACRLEVRTEKRPTALWMDGTKLEDDWTFSDETRMTAIPVGEGDHAIEMALLPNPSRPAKEAEMPIGKADGTGNLAMMKAIFGGGGMRATGQFQGEPGKYDLTIKCAPSGRKDLEARLTAEGNPATTWPLDKAKETVKHVPLILLPEASLELGIGAGRIRSNPVLSMSMKQEAALVSQPHAPADRIETDKGILIEAETFSAEGGGRSNARRAATRGHMGTTTSSTSARRGSGWNGRFTSPRREGIGLLLLRRPITIVQSGGWRSMASCHTLTANSSSSVEPADGRETRRRNGGRFVLPTGRAGTSRCLCRRESIRCG